MTLPLPPDDPRHIKGLAMVRSLDDVVEWLRGDEAERIARDAVAEGIPPEDALAHAIENGAWRRSAIESYEVGQILVHHSGAHWEVIETDLRGDGETWGEGMVLCEGDYRIRSISTPRADRRVHADYLHGGGWRREQSS